MGSRQGLKGWLALLLLGMLAACSVQTGVNLVADKEEQALALAALKDIERGDSRALAGRADPSAAGPIAGAMPTLRAAYPANALPIAQGAFFRSGGGTRTTRIVYAVDGPTGHAVAEVVMTRATGSPPRVTAMSVRPLPRSLRDMLRFPSRDLSLGDYLHMALGLGVLAIIVTAILRIWRSGRFRHRWLWTIGSLLGVTALVKVLPGGDLLFQPFVLQLFGVSLVKANPFQPWVAKVSIPLVAIVVLLIRRGSHVSGPAEDEVA